MHFELYSLISDKMIAHSILFDFPLEEIRMGALVAILFVVFKRLK